MEVPDKPTNRYDLSDRLENIAGNLAGKNGSRRGLEFINDKTICGTCRYAQLMRRESQNVIAIRCDQMGTMVPHDLVMCNKYRNITELSLEQMSQMAVILDARDLLKEGYL